MKKQYRIITDDLGEYKVQISQFKPYLGSNFFASWSEWEDYNYCDYTSDLATAKHTVIKLKERDEYLKKKKEATWRVIE